MNPFVYLASATLLFAACNNSGDGKTIAEIEQMRDEAVAIHDEIMPKISAFDRNTLKIDSLLTHLPQLQESRPDLDTAQTREELTHLKGRLEDATGSMMDWMSDFEPDASTQTKSYYEDEIKKVTDMKQLFDEVSKESADKLAQF